MQNNKFKEKVSKLYNKTKIFVKKTYASIKKNIKSLLNKLTSFSKKQISTIKEKLKENTSNSKNNIKNIKMDKITVKKITICVLLVIALVVQIAFLSYLVKGILPDSKKDEKNAVMSYTPSGSINYRVYLKKNEFISSPYLESGEAYILNLIDYIKINNNYNFSSSSKTKVNGTNKLVASLKVYYKESTNKDSNPEVMSKEKTLTQKTISFDSTSYGLNNEYNLYLNDYLKILRDFQDQIKISVEGYLEVSSETLLNGEVGGIKYKSNYSNVIKIPLTGSVINIESESPNDNTNYVYESELVKSNKKVMTFIIIVNILDFIIICFLLKKLFQFTNKSEYERKLSKILKTYDEIIVNTSNILDIEKYKIIEIPEFKEILDLSRELLLPIMNYEVIKKKETWLYVIKDDILYRFIIKEEIEKKDDKDNDGKEFKENNNVSSNTDNKEEAFVNKEYDNYDEYYENKYLDNKLNDNLENESNYEYNQITKDEYSHDNNENKD